MSYRRIAMLASAALLCAALLGTQLARAQEPPANPPDVYADAVAGRYLSVNSASALGAPDGEAAYLFEDRDLWLRLDMGAGEEATGDLTLVLASGEPVLTTLTLTDADGAVLLRQTLQLQARTYDYQIVQVAYAGPAYRYVELSSSPEGSLAIDAVAGEGCLTCPAEPPTPAPTAIPTPAPTAIPTPAPAPTPELTPLEQWLQGYGLRGPAAAPDADPDGDCAPNALERARGSSPVAADSCVWVPVVWR